MFERLASHNLSTYFAPRGQTRMITLGMHLAQLYLSPQDRLIGVIGDAGSGKSALIRGMFPGLELTNDDNGVYVRPLPLLEQDREFGFFTPHSYHVDIRFENAFTQMNELADAILQALNRGKRVIVEHFELVYPLLGTNADLLIGVGEQVAISRPNIFGPDPGEFRDMAFKSLRYRLMAHTAEDLCEYCLSEEDLARCGHADARHGFILTFPNYPPAIDIKALEAQVKEMIAEGLPITYLDDYHISIGDNVHACTGPRMHIGSTGMIVDFRLLPRFICDRFNKQYLLVGCVGEHSEEMLERLANHQQNAWDD